MKILHVCNRFYPGLGGVETHVLNLAKCAIKDGDQADVLCSDYVAVNSRQRFDKDMKQGRHQGVGFRRLRGFKLGKIDATTFMPGLPLYLIRHARDYDVIHVHSYGYFCSWGSILVCKLLGINVAFTPHYAQETVLPASIKKVFDALIGGWSFRMASKVIALTNKEKESIQQTFRVPEDRVVIIPNGIDFGEIVAKSEKGKEKIFGTYGIDAKKPSVIMVARLAKNKGHKFLLDAYLNLIKKQKCNLIIIGRDWGMEKDIRGFIAKNNLDDAHVLTNVGDEDKHQLIAYSDVLALPSVGGEAFGIVLLEAMSQGVPVVSSNVGGVSDIVVPGKNGYIVEPGDAKALAEGLLRVLQADDYQRLSKFSANYVNAYNWEDINRRIKEVYKHV